jgi:succinate-semialdehyde dehydrogenase/glutarate-semialdehyde dehydrogenase
MPSAHINDAAAEGVKARMVNNGQSCIAAKRFILHKKVFSPFLQEFQKRMESLRIGDPMADGMDVGPLATAEILEQLDLQVQESIRKGAKLVCGGRRLDRPGYYYAPTILTEIPHNSPAYKEELFGPVALFFRVDSPEEAITIANDSSFGLGSSVWTNVEEEKQFFIKELEAGLVFVNGMVVSDPRLPFGGVKHSGYGRELSTVGIREFTNIKTVCIKG